MNQAESKLNFNYKKIEDYIDYKETSIKSKYMSQEMLEENKHY